MSNTMDHIRVKYAKKYVQYPTIVSKKYYTRNEEYLKARNKTHRQNQFSYLVSGNIESIPGEPNTQNNIYRNTVNNINCDNVENAPNNYNYGVQGAISNDLRILNLKQETNRNFHSETNMKKDVKYKFCFKGGTPSNMRIENLKRHLYKR